MAGRTTEEPIVATKTRPQVAIPAVMYMINVFMADDLADGGARLKVKDSMLAGCFSTAAIDSENSAASRRTKIPIASTPNGEPESYKAPAVCNCWFGSKYAAVPKTIPGSVGQSKPFRDLPVVRLTQNGTKSARRWTTCWTMMTSKTACGSAAGTLEAAGASVVRANPIRKHVLIN